MKRGDLNPVQGSLAPSKRFPAVLSGPFAAFWAAYPVRRPNPRAVAADCYARAIRDGATDEQLLAAAGAYAIEVKERGIKEEFIVHARTFLAQRRYLDYLPDPAAAEPAPAAAAPEHPLWSRLQGHLDAPTFQAWIGKCQVLELTAAQLILRAPSSFVAARMREEYLPLIRRVLAADGTFHIVMQLPEAT